MKLTFASSTTILFLGSVAANASVGLDPVHSLYPRGSLARAMLDPNWGKGAFGGTVSAIPVSEAGLEIDEIVTITSTITVTKKRGTKTKRDAAPTAVVKRDLEEGAHAGIKHHHHHHHHHHHKHQHKPEHQKSEVFSDEAVPEQHNYVLSKGAQARLLNDAFSLEMMSIGNECDRNFGQAICIDNKVSICDTLESRWVSVSDCTVARRRCGAAVEGDEVVVSCLNITEIEYPEQRPSEKLHNDLRK